MSRWLEEKDGKYIEEINSMDECRYLVNEVCCNGDCKPMVADFPSEGTCQVCRYFVKEDGVIKDARTTQHVR